MVMVRAIERSVVAIGASLGIGKRHTDIAGYDQARRVAAQDSLLRTTENATVTLGAEAR